MAICILVIPYPESLISFSAFMAIRSVRLVTSVAMFSSAMSVFAAMISVASFCVPESALYCAMMIPAWSVL